MMSVGSLPPSASCRLPVKCTLFTAFNALSPPRNERALAIHSSAVSARKQAVVASRMAKANRLRGFIRGSLTLKLEIGAGVRNGILLPLDGRGGLGADIEHHATYAAHLVGNATGDFLQRCMGQLGPVGCHGIRAFHDPERDHVVVGPFI